MHRANSNDPHNFDLVLDTQSLGLEIAAEVVVQTIEAGRTIAYQPDAGLAGRLEDMGPKPEVPHASSGLSPMPDVPDSRQGVDDSSGGMLQPQE
jgi:hypothetical protein